LDGLLKTPAFFLIPAPILILTSALARHSGSETGA
jgi:hypothetical protein